MKIPTMPAATENGSNTMGAYITNNLWVPALSFNGTGIDANCSSPIFSITGIALDPVGKSKTSINIYIRNFTGVGIYILNANPYGITGNSGSMGDTNSPSVDYETDSLHQGKVIITHFDANKHIVSGTFQIKLIDAKNPSDSVNVSNGRFDVTYPLTQLN